MTPQDISDRILFQMPFQRTDLGVVLGARSISGEVARYAAELYHCEAFPKIAVSGGLPNRATLRYEQLALLAAHAVRGDLKTAWREAANPDYGAKGLEADYIYDVLVKSGVPAADIVLVDRQATNTGQNIQNLSHIIAAQESVTFVTFAPQQRRTLGTARFNPALDHVKMTVEPIYPEGTGPAPKDWDRPFLRRFVHAELRKMRPANEGGYVGKFCTDPDIAAEVRRFEM